MFDLDPIHASMGGVRHQILSDSTVWLSEPTERDVDLIARLCKHSSIAEWTTLPVPYTRLDAEHFVETVVPDGWARHNPTWALRGSDGGEVQGMLGLQRHHSDAGIAEVGFWLGPAARGRGLMTRAVAMVAEYAFAPDGMRLDRLDWRAYVGNHASAAVACRTGFRYEGTQRASGLQRDHRRDQWLAGRLAADPWGPAPAWPQEIVTQRRSVPG